MHVTGVGLFPSNSSPTKCLWYEYQADSINRQSPQKQFKWAVSFPESWLQWSSLHMINLLRTEPSWVTQRLSESTCWEGGCVSDTLNSMLGILTECLPSPLIAKSIWIWFLLMLLAIFFWGGNIRDYNRSSKDVKGYDTAHWCEIVPGDRHERGGNIHL